MKKIIKYLKSLFSSTEQREEIATNRQADWEKAAERPTAVEKLEDQQLLAKVAMEGEDRDVRLAAVEKLEDQQLLAKVAMEDEDRDVWLAAIEKLEDQQLLVEVAKSSVDWDACLAAVEKLEDQQLLAEVAVESVYDDVCLAAVEKLEDQQLLAKVAMEGEDSDVCLAAVEKLKDQQLLAEVAVESVYDDVRLAAAKKLEESNLTTSNFSQEEKEKFASKIKKAKFKVGDRVRVTEAGRETGHTFLAGRIVTITEVYEDGSYCARNENGGESLITEDYMEKEKQLERTKIAHKEQEEKEKTELAGKQTEFARKEEEKKMTPKAIIDLPETLPIPEMDWSSYEIQAKSVNNVIERKIQSSVSDIFFMLNLGEDILTKSIHGVTSGLFEEISQHLGNPITGAESTTISKMIRKNPTWVSAFNVFIDDKSNASNGLSPLLQLFAKLSLDYYDWHYIHFGKERYLVPEDKSIPEVEPVNRVQTLDTKTQHEKLTEEEANEFIEKIYELDEEAMEEFFSEGALSVEIIKKVALENKIYVDENILNDLREFNCIKGSLDVKQKKGEAEPLNRAQNLDTITDVNSFLEIEVLEEKELRAYDDFPEAQQFYGLARNEQHEDVVKLGKELIEKYPDFHSVYRRTARSYHSLGNKQKRNEVYLLGLKKSKNKSGICANIAEHYFSESEFLLAVKWWSKAGGLQLKSGNMKDHNPFLYLAYFAEGLNMPGYEKKLLEIVDNIQQVRFNQTAANEIYQVARSQWGKEIKTAIQKFCTDNIK